MARSYTRVTPQIEGAVIGAKMRLGETASYGDVAEEANVPERTAKYVLVDLPRLRKLANGDERNTASLKQRIVWTLQDFPEVSGVVDLRRILGQSDDEHEITHVLHSLRKQGKVEFTASPGHNEPTHIKLTARGKGLGLRKEAAAEVVAEVVPTTSATPDTATPVEPDHTTPVAPSFPLLAELRAREAKRVDGDSKAFTYMQAAELVRAIDPDAAKLLDERAGANGDTPYPSPLEAEYLAYAEARDIADEYDRLKATAYIHKDPA